MPRRYVTIDVFTDRAFGGNPLAVVLDAEDLDTAAMQAIAREFNYSETTFVLPPADPAHDASVRIFTPAREIPFAGHPNVGTALVLARRASVAPERMLFEEAAGLVAMAIASEDGVPTSAELTAPQPLAIGAAAAAAAIAAGLALTEADIATTTQAPIVASVGLPFLFVQLATRGALARAWPDAAHLPAALAPLGTDGVFLYATDGAEPGCDASARMFFALSGGFVEDPATGSANVALAALLATLAPSADLTLDLRIAQGVDMGRPSFLRARAAKRDGVVVSAHVGGGGVEVMQGTLTWPGG